MSEWTWEQPICEEIFKTKYMLHNEKNIDEVFNFIAEEISSCEKEDIRENVKNKFYNILISGKFIAAGRIIANARPNSKMKNYNNCFTIEIKDSIDDIYRSLLEDAKISKMGGGVGFNASQIRPKGTPLSKGGVASGVISFLKVFDASAKIIMTGGARRSAHICILNCNHPDIEEFITCKQGDVNKVLTQFNISVGITDKFINAVENNADWDLVFNGKIYKTVKAKYLYDLIIENAYKHNEPGIFNLDTVNKNSNSYYYNIINQCNPCGEQPLPLYGVCCLGAVNLTKFVNNSFENDANFDFVSFSDTVRIGVRFLDNVLSVSEFPLEKIEKEALSSRRIGLGFTGLADTFAMLGIKYGSKESKKLSFQIGKILRDTAYNASVDLAQEKGKFEAYSPELLRSNFIKRLPTWLKNRIRRNGLRNVSLLTVAPTGTISFSVGQNCSSGIEPIFSLQYNRNIRTGVDDNTKKETVYDYAWLEYQKYLQKNNFEFIDIPNFFTTSQDIDPYDAVDIQAIFQKYIDSAISKTANLPIGFSFSKYQDLFMYAYKRRLKGFTSFNPDGSMKGILEYEDKYTNAKGFINRRDAPKRPDELECDIHEISVKGEKFIILVGKLNGSLYEIFVTNNSDGKINLEKHKVGKIVKVKKGIYDLLVENGEEKTIVNDVGHTFGGSLGTLARLISMSLRHGTPLQFIVKQLQKDNQFTGFERSVSRVLKKYIKDGEAVITTDVCPLCQSSLIFKEGCMACQNCAWSKCG